MDLCSDTLVACNTFRQNKEGNVYLLHIDGAILALNDLHSKSHYNNYLSHSEDGLVCYNQIRGGDTGTRLQGGCNILRNNHVVNSDAGILFSGGNMNIVKESIFVKNSVHLQGKGTYWSSGVVSANLLDKEIDSNSFGNARLDIKDHNIICQFRLTEPKDGVGRFLIEPNDVNNTPICGRTYTGKSLV